MYHIKLDKEYFNYSLYEEQLLQYIGIILCKITNVVYTMC